MDPATVKEVTNQTEETTQESHPVEEKLASKEEDYIPTESETAHESKEVVLGDEEEEELPEEVNNNHGEDKATVSPIEDDLRLTEDIENEGQLAEEDDEDEE